VQLRSKFFKAIFESCTLVDEVGGPQKIKFHNKFITDHDDKAVVMARYTRKILAELDDQGK